MSERQKAPFAMKRNKPSDLRVEAKHASPTSHSETLRSLPSPLAIRMRQLILKSHEHPRTKAWRLSTTPAPSLYSPKAKLLIQSPMAQKLGLSPRAWSTPEKQAVDKGDNYRKFWSTKLEEESTPGPMKGQTRTTTTTTTTTTTPFSKGRKGCLGNEENNDNKMTPKAYQIDRTGSSNNERENISATVTPDSLVVKRSLSLYGSRLGLGHHSISSTQSETKTHDPGVNHETYKSKGYSCPSTSQSESKMHSQGTNEDKCKRNGMNDSSNANSSGHVSPDSKQQSIPKCNNIYSISRRPAGSRPTPVSPSDNGNDLSMRMIAPRHWSQSQLSE